MNRTHPQRRTRTGLLPLMAWLAAAAFTLPTFAQDAAGLLKQAGVKGGLIVRLGCKDGRLTAALRVGEQYMVHGLCRTAADVRKARAHIQSLGVYGAACVDLWQGGPLPYSDNMVNLVVAESLDGTSMAEIRRVLVPNGVALVRKGARWQKTVKPRPAEIDDWTHYFHGPDGNPVAHDTVVGPPERLQWIGSPRWARHHDHMASLTSLVSANGRLFYIFDEGSTASVQLPSRWRLIARDAFNGTILWKRKIDRWNTRHYPLKSGPAHLLRRLVAVGDRVYATLGIDAPAAVLDATTGQTLLTYEGSQYTKEIVVSDGVVFLVAGKEPSNLPKWRRVSTYVWDNTRTANPKWGWGGGPRQVLAYQASSGERLWQAELPVAPCSLAADAARVVCHDGKKLVCLDRRNGKVLWESEPQPVKLPVQTNTGPRVLIYKNVVLSGGTSGKMCGFAAETGKKLWEAKQKPSGHLSLKDLFVADGLSWTAAIAGSRHDGTFTGYDPVTGKVKKEFPADVKVHWFHHRCYPSKATDKYLITGRNGTEFVDIAAEHWKPHHWVRGGCIYGVMPCNGMVYAPMDSCGCQLEAKLTGLKALAPGPVAKPDAAMLSGDARLERGPVYSEVVRSAASPSRTAFGRDQKSEISDGSEWPTYRHDAARSGATAATVPSSLKQAWAAQIGGRLSPPTVAAGKVFVSSIDTHTLHALDAATGRALWRYTTGGRIDSPPTYYRGLALFGSTDGWVYALRAADGQLAWRFRAAPMDRRMMAWEQLESAWPVHGSVLVHDGVLYCTAGRSIYLDGGIRFIRLDPTTGKLLGEVLWNDKDPESGEDMHLAYLKKTQGNNMPVGLSDVLSCDGRHIWMRSQKIDFEGKRLEIGLQSVNQQPAEDCHMFCQVGFLDDSWFFRTYWTYGRRVSGGYGAWLSAGRLVPAGRILALDGSTVYGYGRKPEYMVNSSVVEYQLFAADRAVTEQALAHVRSAGGRISSRSDRRNANSSDWRLRHFFPSKDLSAVNFQWTMQQPSVIARALAVAGDTLFAAGPPDIIDERRAYRLPDDEEIQAALARQAEALEGKHGGQLWAVSKKDGKPTARYAVDAIPVFDGLAAAGGRLYMSTTDGRVACMAARGTALARIDDQPLQVAWDKPEDPSYLLPPPVSKDKDFDKLARCKAVESKLGYRLRVTRQKQVGLAVKQLDDPITGAVTFKTRMKAAAGVRGLLSNGYLVFGDAADEAKLVKCGAQLRVQRARLIQGPMRKGKGKSEKINVPERKALAITVAVDLSKQSVTYTANAVKLEAKLTRPMKSITHIGYCMDGSVIDFAPIKIERR